MKLYAIGALLMFAFGMAAAIRIWRRRHATKRTPIDTIASADEQNTIHIRGMVHSLVPLTAPLTGRPCVYYRIELAVYGRGVLDAARVCNFTVRDDTGVAHARPDCAQFIDVVADMFKMGRASELSDQVRTVLKQHEISIPEVAGIELREAIVGLDKPIALLGNAVREPDPERTNDESGYRDPSPTRLIFSGPFQVVGGNRESVYIGAR